MKRAIALKFERQSGQRSSLPYVLRSRFSKKIPYAGFSHRRSHNISDSLFAKELWRRKQTSPSGSALRIGSFTAIIPRHPVNNYNICDRLRENPAYGINAQVAQCSFLVARVKNCQTSDFVISMSNNPSTNCYRRLQRLNVSY